jgi:hypothetical protein
VTQPYDSAADTLRHIRRVNALLLDLATKLLERAAAHDESKLEAPEKAMFDEFTPLLRTLTYGSPEYDAARAAMGEALRHHYAHNSHHPEHYAAGINGMSLLDLVEMLVDWKAAGERHADGDMAKSLEINRSRFGEADLWLILQNTAREMGWIE